MQSVRLKKSLHFPRSARRRQYSYLFHALLLTTGMLCATIPGRTQTLPSAPSSPESSPKYDVGVGGFYQVTGAANGNFIRDDTTESGGALISLRRPWKPWAGYEVNVGYTKFFEAYNKGVVKLESNVTDLSVSYLFQSPTIYGVQPFFSIGGGIIYFAPIDGTITNSLAPAVTRFSGQLLPEFTWDLGLNYPVFSRFGVRGGLRGLKYKTPDFHQFAIDTKTLRTTLEPNIGVYYRF
jgi:hypothetical protein